MHALGRPSVSTVIPAAARIPLGLYDLDRKIRPVGEAYRRLIGQWKEILPTLVLMLGY